MNRKSRVKVATIVLTLFIAGGLFYILQYYHTLKNNREEWYRTQYLEKEFRGIIKDIEYYNYDESFLNEFVGLSIVHFDSEEAEIHYGMLSFKKEPLLKSFVEVGDSVFKKRDEKQVTFKKVNGQVKTFILPIDIRQ